jgi:hypothetical protein
MFFRFWIIILILLPIECEIERVYYGYGKV